ncbi:MAG: hypothetical protein ABI870_13370 [Rhodanobacter sp.]
MVSDVRGKGLLLFGWTGALFLALAYVGYLLNRAGWKHVPWEVAIPAGFALSGAVQAITGVPFTQFAARWDALRGWQRGVLGIALILAVFSLFMAAVVTFA